ncbi:MAG: redox-regulated ATPase YchF [Acidimicrobiaceae bacterium]|nr:redox-regulated ATPase YchF [Acidimicrobiaceae bacterium]MDE0517410.1 redox-regulated ATPase YchF [Acidimicrobiaceae bacterium]MDE0655045.1 redox-regulated ATPase YchF [Acidimicrobiaceae bacterium]MXZ96247.1 redox-regulated ATPase YchF [Acidimicrobiaceae bacterium]MYF44304.1 redox-regulated ATPase YchF [Acidimicrobiaceae bacterium]
MERFGFVGLPNSGKTSLHNALAGGDAVAARHAFSTKSANVGVARVPDVRLLKLAAMSSSRRTVHASVQFTDIGGLVAGSNRGEGLGNAFLGHVRDTDAIVYVLRAFTDPDVGGDDDPLNSLRVLETELALADLDSAARQLDKLARAAKGDPSLRADHDLLAQAIGVLEDGVPLYRAGWDGDARAGLRPFFLLTNKPVLAVVNIGEDQIDAAEDLAEPVRVELGEAEVMALCVQLEAEAAQLDESERPGMLAALGLGSGALDRFLTKAYHLLGLRTFLTTAGKESRAWTFRAGASAAECAGSVHSDFRRGFIRADTISCDKLLEAGSWVAARDQGLVRSEGKDYPVADGDVMEFKFNV